MSIDVADQWGDERARALDDEFADVISGHRLEDWLGEPDSVQHAQRGWRPGCYHHLDQWAQHGSRVGALGNHRQGLLTVIGAAWAAADGGATWRETVPWLTVLAAEPTITRRYALESMLIQWVTASDPRLGDRPGRSRSARWQQWHGPPEWDSMKPATMPRPVHWMQIA